MAVLLKDTDEIRPGQVLTVEVGGFVSSFNVSVVENNLAQAFNGTLFAVSGVHVPVLTFFNAARVFGAVQAVPGLTTTAPHRNLLGAEFRAFADDRLSRVPGIVSARAEKINLGIVEAALLPDLSLKSQAFAAAAVLALILVAVAVIVWKVA